MIVVVYAVALLFVVGVRLVASGSIVGMAVGLQLFAVGILLIVGMAVDR